VQPIGKLHQEHTDVTGHGEQEFAEILRSALVLALCFDLGELRHPIHKAGNVLPELLLDLLGRRDRVLDRVVQDCGDDRLVVEVQVGQDARTSIGWL
jgi:hypothetical protein